MPSSDKRAILLMHPVRREIYRIVSESPGSYFFDIASTLDLPHGTTAWHLKKLEDAGLVDTMRFAGKRVFFSKALRSADVEKAFVVLRSEATQQVFAYILNNEGCYQSQIAEALNHHHDTIRHHINRLVKVKLIVSVKKGRTTHYYLGEIGKKILDSNTEIISQAYVEYLMSVLKDECLTPEIIEHLDGKITIRLSCPGFDDVYFSISLKGWEFIPKRETIGDEPPIQRPPKILTIDDMGRRPKIIKLNHSLEEEDTGKEDDTDK